jgi:multidrug efflux system membrane fusion protein
MKKIFSPGRIVAVVIIIVALAAGYHFYTAGAFKIGAAAPASAPGASRPPTPVTVQTMSNQKVRLWTEFSGRMHAVDYAEIRPEVSGRIMEVRFQDGQTVKQGDLLFVIEPQPYEAAVERDLASLESAKSKVILAKIDLDRANNLVATHAIAQSEQDTAANAYRVSQADQDNADAQLKQAKIDLEHAYVTAPISGRMSRAEITVGNLVQSGIGAPLLTSLVSENGIYADFEVDEQTYLQTIRNTANGNAQEGKIPVQLAAQGDTDPDHMYNGFMQSFDNRIDAASGTIRARARFENKDGTLVPGMFVTVKLAGSQDRDALLVPERAVSFDQDKKFVYVVDESNKVSYREIQLGQQVGSQRVVESGLNAGDRVVVDGLQMLRPNDVVAPKEIENPADEVAKTAQP